MAGDQLLREIADRMQEHLQPADQLAGACDKVVLSRLGGDEFLVLLEGLTRPEAACAFADRLLSAFSVPYHLAGHVVYATASIGVVTSFVSYASADEVIRDADTAMYEAKSAGRARYVMFDESMRRKADQRLRIENDLRSAVANDEFALAYQPIVSLETGRLAGFEALVRWIHPHRGTISPADFIPIAEETGLIIPIGSWVLDEACRQLAAWQHSLGAAAPACVHVNLSRKHLVLPNLVGLIGQTLEKHDVAPQCLHIEVTESGIMYDARVAVSALNGLRRLGVKIDMDDFGTGHSSLSCLREFPVDVLKIDKAFVANVRHGRDFVALLHAAVTLANNLGLQVVAEGIEQAEQVSLLQALGCEFGQGYFFAKPMLADTAEEYLLRMAATDSSELQMSAIGPCLDGDVDAAKFIQR